jgi:hypothetical protein
MYGNGHVSSEDYPKGCASRNLRDLEAAWNKFLEHTERIVLLRGRLHLLDVCCSIASKRILGVVRIIEV